MASRLDTAIQCTTHRVSIFKVQNTGMKNKEEVRFEKRMDMAEN